MVAHLKWSLLLLSAASIPILCRQHQRPNILYILADDLGYNDVDWHDRELRTPHLRALAFDRYSVRLENSYVNQLCSPTRSALLSGYYPFHLGTQHGTFFWMEPAGVPLTYRFFPERLQSIGYRTHLVGKWHLGYCKHDYLPTRRGFDTFRGYYSGMEDYYKHGMYNTASFNESGMDFWKDTPTTFTADWPTQGIYSTDIYANEAVALLNAHDRSHPFFIYLAFQAVHNPMQAPDKYLADCAHIARPYRRIFCGMVSAMDRAIGRVVDTLRSLQLYENTIIIFSSDNGGDTNWGGNNYPLRGNKDTLWEGGTRIVSFVHAPHRIHVNGARNELFSVVDWYATIMAMTGASMPKYGDGYNYWPLIANNSRRFARTGFVYNIDSKQHNAGIRVGNYKLIVGDPGEPSGWYPPSVDPASVNSQRKSKSLWLFDIKRDPTEKRNLSTQKPKLLHRMMSRLRQIAIDESPSVHRRLYDERGDPKHFNGTFASGWC